MTVIAAIVGDSHAQFIGRVNQLDAIPSSPGIFQMYLRGNYAIEVPETVQLRLDGLDELYQQARDRRRLERRLRCKLPVPLEQDIRIL